MANLLNPEYEIKYDNEEEYYRVREYLKSNGQELYDNAPYEYYYVCYSLSFSESYWVQATYPLRNKIQIHINELYPENKIHELW